MKILNNIQWELAAWFGINAAASLLILSITDHELITRAVFQQSFSGQLDSEQISHYFDQSRAFLFYNYPALVLFLAGKYLLVAFILVMGADCFGRRISFPAMLKTVLVAELVFLIPAGLKMVHFLSLETGYSVDDLKNYSSFSLESLLGINKPGIWQYPLQALSIWEAVYWLLLALGIRRSAKLDFNSSLQIVLSSYFPALCCWLLTVAFVSFMIRI